MPSLLAQPAAASHGDPKRIEAAASFDAGGPLFPGLQIELQEIWSG
jgi:hypothetical protein